MRKWLFYAWCIGAMALFVWLTKRMLSNFSAEVVWGGVIGYFIGVGTCVWWDRYVCRLGGDPSKQKWWQAPAKDFITSERADYMQEAQPARRAETTRLPPAGG